jgi:hypothetical protein
MSRSSGVISAKSSESSNTNGGAVDVNKVVEQSVVKLMNTNILCAKRALKVYFTN